MISGSTNENSIPKLANRAGVVCQRSIAIANKVPERHGDQHRDHRQLQALHDRRRNAGSWNNESVGSCHHHRNENPCQMLRDRPALNENAIAMNTGTIDHAM